MVFKLKQYVCNHKVIIPNYHRRRIAVLRVSTALVEPAVNSLVNQRMNKRRQMRWTEDGAQPVLSVRTAILNGEFKLEVTIVENSALNTTPAMALVA